MLRQEMACQVSTGVPPMRVPSVVLAAWLVVVSHCGCSYTGGGTGRVLSIGEYRVEVQDAGDFGGGGWETWNGMRRYEYHFDDVTLTILGADLFVNERSYGSLNSQDKVVIARGRVWVDDHVRPGMPLTSQEYDALHPVIEHQVTIGGTRAVLRGRSISGVSTSPFGRQSVEVDDITLSVVDGMLYVNNERRQRVRREDVIVVSSGEVEVHPPGKMAVPIQSKVKIRDGRIGGPEAGQEGSYRSGREVLDDGQTAVDEAD